MDFSLNLDYAVSMVIYVVAEPINKLVKIGFSRDVQRRIGQLQIGMPYKLKLVQAFPVEPSRARSVETAVHRALAPHKVAGEWFVVPRHVATAAVANAVAGRAIGASDAYTDAVYRKSATRRRYLQCQKCKRGRFVDLGRINGRKLRCMRCNSVVKIAVPSKRAPEM